MIKLCVFDVDGTLYDYYNGRILDSTIMTLKQLQAKGIKIAVATGRAHYGLGKALNDLNFDYICAVNGGVIVDSKGKVIVQHDFSIEDVEHLNSFAKEHEAGLLWKFMDHMYIYQYVEKIDWVAAHMRGDVGKEPFVFDEAQKQHLVALPQSASLHAPASLVRAEFGNSSTMEFIQYSEDGFDVVLKHMDKGIGLTSLMEALKLDRSEVMVFGDNYNDLPMFACADYRVAMGNAVDAVLKRATYVTADCAHDGIYEACVHYQLI